MIHKLPLARLQRFDCGSRAFDAERFPTPPFEPEPGAKMPTLGEVFELAREAPVHFNIETKMDRQNPDSPPMDPFVGAVLGAIAEHDMLSRSTLQSFDWAALRYARTLEPGLRTAALFEPRTFHGKRWHAGYEMGPNEDVLDLLRAAQHFVTDFSPHWSVLLPGTHYGGQPVSAYQEAGFAVIPWTVNDPTVMEALIDLGVDGLITDRPDLLMEIVRKRGLKVAPAPRR